MREHHASWKVRLLACLLVCAATLVAFAPSMACAEENLSMTEGDVAAGFVPAGTVCESSDPSIAWVDSDGNLNALKCGTTTITCGEQTYVVSVADYSDGSDVVGNLKILARYNDSMQFYDGHVYLLFTSYQDGVQINVDDLYGCYQIQDSYYEDMRQSIANGSNHTGSDADKYFEFTNDTSVTLDRGELVTIGMYRDFNMSVFEAAAGSIQNSTMWAGVSNAAKSAVMDALFKYLDGKTISSDEAIAKIRATIAQEGMDYNLLLDGVVPGGLCFNRELYNQKLEWDQYENVTYDLDITANQLNTLAAYLGGNLNKFSILKNSCATVALRAWNAAVGTRDGADTAYKLNATGTGIFSVIDAPKTARDAIVDRLPGHYLNNAAGVAEPDAGYEDETGWVYVSGPKKVEPVAFAYEDGDPKVDETRNNMLSLVRAATAGAGWSYGANPLVTVGVETTTQGELTTIDRASFSMDDKVAYLDAATPLEDGIWFGTQAPQLEEGEECVVTDADGNVLPSECADGKAYFHADALPVTFKVRGSNTDVRYALKTTIDNANEAKATTEVYTKDGDVVTTLGTNAELESGKTIYVRSTLADDEKDYVLSDITLNGTSIMDAAHLDAIEGAYAVAMPKAYAKLRISYQKAVANALKKNTVQVSVRDVLNVSDYAELLVGKKGVASDHISWRILSNDDQALELAADASNKALVANKVGTAVVWAGSSSNASIGVPFSIEVCEDVDRMVEVTFGEGDYVVLAHHGDQVTMVPNSGYLVQKGTVLEVVPTQTNGTVVSEVLCNGNAVAAGQAIVANENTSIDVSFKKATIKGVPGIVKLGATGDSRQIDASVSYTGSSSQLPVYDANISYESSDPLVSVDQTGKITLAGKVPAEGKAVIVTAYAGSSNNSVRAECKVVVGNYQGERIVGRLTIHARSVSSDEPVPHGCVTFTTYGDVDLDVSYYNYFRPTSRYMDLMADYRDNPQNYTSDPALYANNELGLQDRESYFEVLSGGAESDVRRLSLRCGESISISNYSYDATNFITVMNAFENGDLASSQNVQALVEQMHLYSEGGEYDGAKAFDSLVASMVEMYKLTEVLGYNPVNGHTLGGMDINREMYNQFRRNDSQTPNNFYTVEITADELADLKRYLSNPQNNHYSLFTKNCATAAVDIWNDTLSHRPELRLTANYTGLLREPESLWLELQKLGKATGKTYEPGVEGKEEGAGKDFYPRTVTCKKRAAQVTQAPKARQLTYSGSKQKLVQAGVADGGTMAYSLDGKTFVAEIPTAKKAGTYTVYYKAIGVDGRTDSEVRSVRATIARASIAPTVTIKGWVSTQKANKPKVSGNLGKGAVKYTYAKAGSKKFTTKVPTAPGNYVVKATIAKTTNYLAGVATANFRITSPAPMPSASIAAHVQKLGWLKATGNGKMAGTAGQALRMEALQISLVDADVAGGIEYRSHVQAIGWEKAWARDGADTGTTGSARRLEAIQVRLYGKMAKKYDVYYRVHAQHYGWMGWAKNGQQAGTAGMSYRLEAIQVVLVKKGDPAPATTYKGISQAYAQAFAKK